MDSDWRRHHGLDEPEHDGLRAAQGGEDLVRARPRPEEAFRRRQGRDDDSHWEN